MAEMNVEQQRVAHYAFLASLMPELIGRLSWSRAQIEAHRTAAFRELLRHVRAHSPWHARRTAHLDPCTATLADIVRLPTMTKSDLMENWDEIVTIPGASRREAEEALRKMTDQFYIWGDNVLFASGGTGGQPGLFLCDWSAAAATWAGMARGFMGSLAPLAMRGIEVPQQVRLAWIAAEMSAHASYVMGRIFSNPHNPTHRLSAWRSADELIPELNAIQPHFVGSYPSFIPALAAATKAGELKIEPRVMYFGAEHLSDGRRQLARQTWPQADILTCWGTSEGGGTFPCPNGDGFHISEDLVIIEPVDDAGAPVAPGERSAGIYFTNLVNKALPIIRYYIDDIFEMSDGSCACGSSYQKVRQVHGRSLEMFRYEAISVHPATLELAVLEQPRILEYQIRQTPRGAHLVYRSKGEIDAARLSVKMRQALLSYGLQEPEITIEKIAHLERTAAGKLKHYVPLTH
ncbi:MAG: phenylacetate--CoA ligase family protein [Alphaproteobacteria bacterium]|nr:phenylacetate--CoA ligase family protein [Alphaproteobacteria bacterium]MDE2631138.1 phenylacetate--CoA ligase family protein [Alphaproteobacteria bacterium]